MSTWPSISVKTTETVVAMIHRRREHGGPGLQASLLV
jgi:hypothetical protein